MDEATLLGIETASQPTCVRVQGSGLRGAFVGPDGVKQLLLGEDPVRVRGEGAQEVEFFDRQVDLALADGDPAAERVDDEVADPPRAVLSVLAATEDGPDPGAQLRVAEGLAFRSFVWPDPNQ